ncbi:MAG: histidine kinase [Gammaproteobacteria bacterium]|nr:histidine kinase [Gammaproteobacteria bacterium]MCW8839406.1 histidine kinase [Gammaproteobacteria bacterium]MCW8959259.1 histidine kinase [Gammaproteobacteria bacterium]MCW8973350.1 histidine kinase [Gammaproteobacteria bacterium]MCW8992883.1 histidine kinase [Gammaproteobacteria bacterium]
MITNTSQQGRLQRMLDALTSLLLLSGEGLPGRRLRFLLIGVGNTFALLGLNLALLLHFPEYENILLFLFGVFILAGVGLLFAISLAFRRYLLHPSEELKHWSDEIREGNLAIRLNPEEMGGLTEVSKDINNLLGYLQNLSSHMDDEIKRQTKRFEQKTNSLQVLYDVAASLNASRDLKDLLTRFLHTMRDIVNAKAGTVRLLTENNMMELVASIGLTEAVIEEERMVPVQRCLCGNAVTEGEVLFQQDLTPCTQWVGQPLLGDTGLEMIAVPLQYHGKNLGVYNLFVEKADIDSREEVKALFTSIGRHLGMAIEKAHLDDEAKRLSIIKERNALAHELHDSLAQTLASLRFQVSMLDEAIDQQGADVTHEDIQQIKSGLDEAYTELRELLAHFRAPINSRGLIPALEDLISNFRKQTGMHVLLQKEWDSTRLPANMEMQVLRIIQEALANVRKHSDAHTVRVMLRCDRDGNYHILVEDDGVGMDKPAFSGHPGEHLGLSIMKERARYLGGELRIESESSEGTRVQLTFHSSDGSTGSKNKEPQHFALI